MPSKLSTLNATAWTEIGKRRVAAMRERRAMENDVMNECIRTVRNRGFGSSMLISKCVDQDFRRECCNGMP